MKKSILTERQTVALMNLGRAVDEALAEFPDRNAADVSSAAHQAYSSMLGLAAPTAKPAKSAPQKRAKAKPRKARPAAKAKAKAKPAQSASAPPKSDKVVKILNVLQKAKAPMPASEISEKTGIPGQGLGPVLHMMFGAGNITKKEVEGVKVWGAKMNGKSTHISVN